MGESERERDRERETSDLPLLCFSLPLSQMVSERGFCHQLFPPKTKANAKWGEGAAGWDFGRQGLGGGG